MTTMPPPLLSKATGKAPHIAATLSATCTEPQLFSGQESTLLQKSVTSAEPRRDQALEQRRADVDRSANTSSAGSSILESSLSKQAKQMSTSSNNTPGRIASLQLQCRQKQGQRSSHDSTSRSGHTPPKDSSADGTRRKSKGQRRSAEHIERWRRGRTSDAANEVRSGRRLTSESKANSLTVHAKENTATTAPSSGTRENISVDVPPNTPQLPFLSFQQHKEPSPSQILADFRSAFALQEALARSAPGQSAPLVDANWNNNVYVNNLPPQTTDDELYRMGTTYGRVKSHKAIINQNTGLCKGYGFIMYESLQEAELAMSQLPLHGLTASWAKESFTAKLRRMADTTTSNVYLSNLPLDFTTFQLEELFAPHPIVSMRLLVDPATRRPRGVGFVRLRDRKTAEACIEKLHGNILEGQTTPIQVRFADSDAQKYLKQTIRSPSPKSDNDKPTECIDPHYLAGLYSLPCLPKYASPSLSPTFDISAVMRNKENVHPSVVPTLSYYGTHDFGPQSYNVPHPHLVAQHLTQGNLLPRGYLTPPQHMSPANDLYGIQHPRNVSGLLNPSSLSLSQNAPNGRRASASGERVPAVYIPSVTATRHARSIVENKMPAAIMATDEPKSEPKEAASSKAHLAKLVQRAAQDMHKETAQQSARHQCSRTQPESEALSPSHPLSSTPLRLSVPILQEETNAVRKTQPSRPSTANSAQFSRSTSAASSISPLCVKADQDILATTGANDYGPPLAGVSPGPGNNEAKEGRSPISVSHSSTSESFKTGKDASGSRGSPEEEESDSLEVYCGIQAPVTLTCPAPRPRDESMSLSKTDSGKEVDHPSDAGATPSVCEKKRQLSSTAESGSGEGDNDRETMGDDDVLPINMDPLPLSEPATIVPDSTRSSDP